MATAAVLAIGALAVTACSKADPEPKAFVVGDSLTVGAEIGGLGVDDGFTVDAEEGRTTEEGVAVVEATDLSGQEQVIVALGTNDYTDTTDEFTPKVDAMMAALGSEIPITWVNVDTATAKLAPAAAGVNAALAAAADRYPNLTIADWTAYLNSRDDADDLRAGDGVHDSTEGYRVRAEWMAGLAQG